MFILKTKKREVHSKGKRLRKEGLIPAVLYGKHLDESVLVQIIKGDVDLFLKTNAIGSKLELEIDGEKHLAMLKELTRTPGTTQIEHLAFIALKADEKVNTVSRIVLIGREAVQGIVLQTLDEISYRAFPSHIFDTVELNVEHLTVGQNITIADLDIAQNPDIEISNSMDSVIVTVSARKEYVEETPDDEEGETEPEQTDAEEA